MRRERVRINNEKRRTRMAAARARGNHTLQEWLALRAEFDNRCVRCGHRWRSLERDHITPIYLDGSNGIDNIQPLCSQCNSSKGPETTNWVKYRRAHGFGNAV
jgi:5-methylcytosine-specific restriction endonuclease McrA